MKLRSRALALAVAAAPSLAWGQQEITQPDWLRRPTQEQARQALPRGVARGVTDGSAIIACIVTVQGALRDCRVERENPPGMGFGEAALLLTPHFLMRPAMKDGRPVEGTVHIPLAWKDWSTASAPDGAAPTGSFIKPKPNSTRVVGRLPWKDAPSVADIVAAYPEKAKAAKAGGRAVLDCTVTPKGHVTNCRTATETPTGYGFAGAARALAAKFVTPTEVGGQSLVDVHTQLMFTFDPTTLEEATPVIGKPDWTALPDSQDFVRVFPAKARQAGILQARVVMGCQVQAGGVLGGCEVQSEDPSGYGFGEATKGLAEKFHVNVWTAEGLPTIGGTLRIPLRYDLRDTEAK